MRLSNELLSFTSMAARVSSKQTPAGSHVKKSVSKSSRPHDFLGHSRVNHFWNTGQCRTGYTSQPRANSKLEKGNTKGRGPRLRVKKLGGMPDQPMMMVMVMVMMMMMIMTTATATATMTMTMTMEWHSSGSFLGLQ